MNTCKTCKHWNGQSKLFVDHYADSALCEKSQQGAENCVPDIEMAYSIDDDGEYNGVWTGRDFGCIYWEKRNE